MRALLHWVTVGFVLTFAAAAAQRPEVEALAVDEPAPRRGFNFPAAIAPISTSPTSPIHWCEPLDLVACESSAECLPLRDGTQRVCAPEWWVPESTRRVCLSPEPSEDEQLWRADRLRVLVNEICKVEDVCDPEQLHAYLSVLIDRESKWRPYVGHKLRADRRGSERAWVKHSAKYVQSPAHDEPKRWSTGLGYFGANPTYQLSRWDASAVPEVLCGEVEAVLVHLRAARERHARLVAGVTCDSLEHHGTSDDEWPSWYDVSLVNSGSDACPGTEGNRRAVRDGFEERADRVEIDPYASVSTAMLGRDVSRAVQVEFAATVRARMDRQHPKP